MSASDRAKEVGLDSLAEVSELSGVSRQTLTNWYHEKPELFNVVIKGCVAMKPKSEPLRDFIARLSRFLTEQGSPQEFHQQLYKMEVWFESKIKAQLMEDDQRQEQEEQNSRTKKSPFGSLTGRQIKALSKEVPRP